MAKEFQWMFQDSVIPEQFESLRDQALDKKYVLERLPSAIGQKPTENSIRQDLESPILLRQTSNEKGVHPVAFYPLTVVAGANSRLGMRYFLYTNRGVRPVLVPLDTISDYGLVPTKNSHGVGFFVTKATATANLGLEFERYEIPVVRDDKAILGEDFADYHGFFSGK